MVSGAASGGRGQVRRSARVARPWVYWFWLDGNITKEGITADLEAMKRTGIGGVLIMEVDQGAPKGPARFAGPEWRELFKFVCSEASRLGLEVNMNNDAGWCGSGGPWITPELSMQKVVWSETHVEGARRFEGALIRPPAVRDYYRDITVLAFPTPAGEDVKLTDLSPKMTSSSADPGTDLRKVIDGDPKTAITLPRPEKGAPQFVQIEFPQPYTARIFRLTLAGPQHPFSAELQCSDDGKAFKVVRGMNQTTREVDFPAVTARYFRVLFTSADPKLEKLSIAEMELSPRCRIENIQGKASFTSQHFTSPAQWSAVPAELTIPRQRIVDLTAQMDASGKLAWDVPAGKWTILRFGHTTTGAVNSPAPSDGRGLECDKFSKQAAEAMFDGLMGKLIADSKPLAGEGKALVSTHIDSWEVGSQNWTPARREEFRRLRGYDILPFLPVFTGRVVDSMEISERFLWDLRQTVSDLIVENYAGHFRTLAGRHGMRLSIEAYDGVPCDEMTYAGQADEPMGEFWSWGKYGAAYSCTEMTSAAHVYGKRITGAEAFTATDAEKWLGHPAIVKDLGDWAFCEGINRFVFHRYALQPWRRRPPGMSMGPWGLHYERTQTWWEQSKAWHEYLARCQYLLQQGLFVADVCYLQPEGAPRRFAPPATACAAPIAGAGTTSTAARRKWC